MKVIAAFPDRAYLDSLSPVLGAFGEPVIKPTFGANGAVLSSLELVEAFQAAASKVSGSAVIATSHTPSWVAFDELLRDTSQHRALIFFESASASIAHSLAARHSSYRAVDQWLGYARGLLELVKSHSSSITLVDVNSAYSATRSLMGICAARFPFELIDPMVDVKKPVEPDPAFLLMARELVRQSKEIQLLESRLNEFAVALGDDQTTKLDIDYLAVDRHALLEAETKAQKAESHAADQRQARLAAEIRAEELSRKLDRYHQLLQKFAPLTLQRNPGQQPQEKVADLEGQLHQMRLAWEDVQSIAEKSTLDALRHESEAAEAWAEVHRLREELDGVRSGRTQTGAQVDGSKSTSGKATSHAAPRGGKLAAVRSRLSPSQFKHRAHRKLILNSGYFDADWYEKKYPDIVESGVDPLDHYLMYGGQEGRAPGPNFSSFRYLKDYPDVASEGVNPLLHYLLSGQKEGRKALPPG